MTEACTPLKRVSTVRKYDPMGITIMPRVKASSFMMTDLRRLVSRRWGMWCRGQDGSVIRGDCGSNVGLLVGCWAGADAVVLLEKGLLLGDDPAGRHDGTGKGMLLSESVSLGDENCPVTLVSSVLVD